jgi:ribosome-binding factor A
MSLRLERVRELLKRELGEIIRRELPVNEAGLISVNDVIVSSDLHSATVFVGIFGSAEKRKRAVEMLDQNRKRIQGLVAQSVILKYTPQLRFVLDDSIERGNRVMQILDELEEKEEKK